MQYRYFVVSADPTYKLSVHQDLTSDYGTDTVPDRPVVCKNPMNHSEYNGIYMLTPEEAEELKNDPRIADVHRDPADLGLHPKASSIQTGTFVKLQASLTATDLNWGLARSISTTDNFAGSNTATTFTYNLNGSGVDLVFLDTGILKYHPEFAVNADGSGGTRVVEINWAQYGIISSKTSWMGDLDGHGSNCASIAAGNTNGWAKGASIYAFNILDSTLPSYTDPVSALQTLRAWHNAKPIDTNTGYKRPTVCSNSWGYEIQYSNMTATVYRGVTYPTSAPNNLYGQVSSDGSLPAVNTSTTTFGLRVSSIEAEIQSCINAGIVFVGAAGNHALKIDVSSGLDYNNYWIDNTNTQWYYHRGTTPSAVDNVVCVGATSYAIPEHKISFSDTGPRIDVFAPGAGIMGAYTNTPYATPAVADPRSSVSTSTNTTFYLNKISGTSQSTPQVAGVLACMLQSRPWMQAWQCQQWIQQNAAIGTLNETYYGQTGTYTNYAGLQGATNAQLYQPFNAPNPWSITSN
jgi:hypothetical protein